MQHSATRSLRLGHPWGPVVPHDAWGPTPTTTGDQNLHSTGGVKTILAIKYSPTQQLDHVALISQQCIHLILILIKQFSDPSCSVWKHQRWIRVSTLQGFPLMYPTLVHYQQTVCKYIHMLYIAQNTLSKTTIQIVLPIFISRLHIL